MKCNIPPSILSLYSRTRVHYYKHIMISPGTYNLLQRVYNSGPEELAKSVIKFYPLDEIAFIEKSFHENFIEVLKACPKVIREICNDINGEMVDDWFYQPIEYKRIYSLVQLNPVQIEYQINSLRFEPNIAYNIMRCESFILMNKIQYLDTTIDCDVTKHNLFWQIITATHGLNIESHQRDIMFGAK